MNNILKIPAFQRKKAIPKQLKDLELLPLNEEFSKLTMPIVSDDDLRPVMMGNYFDLEKRKIASTDAHKLIAINMPNETFNYISNNYKEELQKEPKGLIFHTISQLQKDYNDLVKLAYKNNSTDFQSFNEFIKQRAIQDGRYPNYEAVTPKEFVAEINVDYQKLYWYAKVLVDAKVIDDINKIDSGNYYVYQNKKIEYLKDSYVSFLNPSTKQILLTYTLDGKKEYIGFNARLLCEILKFAMELNGKYFGKVGVNATGKAMVIELENGLNVSTDSIGLIMPIILNRGESTNTIGNDGSPLDEMKTYEMYYDLDTNSIISDKENYPIDEEIGFMPNKVGSTQKMTSQQGKMEKHYEMVRKVQAERESKVENNLEDLIDKKIRGLRIALKVAKQGTEQGDEKLIEKRILALEIAKKMSSPKFSVSEKMSNLDNNKIKDWYIKNYPADDLKNKLDDKNTFEDLWNGLGKNKDIYEIIGIGDSIIRERLFEHLAELKNVSYNVVYNKWLDKSEDIGSELNKSQLSKIRNQYYLYGDNNYHSENVLLLAKNFGTNNDINDAKEIIKKHEKDGHLTSENSEKRRELSERLILKARKIMAEKGVKFTKGGSVDDEWYVMINYYEPNAKEDRFGNRLTYWRKTFNVRASSKEESIKKATDLFNSVKANKNRQIQSIKPTNMTTLKKIVSEKYPRNWKKLKDGGSVGNSEIEIATLYGKMLNQLGKEKQFNKKFEKKVELDKFSKSNGITIDNNNIISINGIRVAFIDKINQKTGQEKSNWEIKKFNKGGSVDRKIYIAFYDDYEKSYGYVIEKNANSNILYWNGEKFTEKYDAKTYKTKSIAERELKNIKNKANRMEDGGSVKNNFYKKFGDDNLHLVKFDLSVLDDYEEMQFNHFSKSSSKAESLQILINNVEGDYSQLSPTLSKIAEEQYPSDEFFEENRQYVKGGSVDGGDYVREDLNFYKKGGGVANDSKFYVKSNFGNWSVIDRKDNKMVVGYSKKEDAKTTSDGLNKIDNSDELKETISILKSMKGYGHFLNNYAKGGYTRPSYKINTTGFFSFKTKDKEYIVRSSFFERKNDIEDSLQIQDELRGELGSIIITNSAWKRLSDGNTIKARSNKGNLTGTLTRVANLNENYSLNKMAKDGNVSSIDKVRERVNDFLNPLGYSAKVEESIGSTLYTIEPNTRKVGNNRSDFFDGMQIIAENDGTFEVSEYMAGKNENELHIYLVTKSLTLALKDLIKGNKRKPIKKYFKTGGMIKGGKVLASSSTKEGIIKLIAQYLYGSTITLVETDNDKIYEVHNKKGKTSFYVEFSRGKYRFIQPSMFKAGGQVEFHDYKGIEIMYEPNEKEYYANDMVFYSLEDAHEYIDSGEANKTPKHIVELYRRGMMANGGSVGSQDLYKLAEEMSEKDFRNKFLTLSKSEKENVESLIRLGDDKKLALITILDKRNEPNNDDFYRQAYHYKAGGDVEDEKVYIDYMNKEKGFKRDRIYFDSYAEAVEWGKKNFERFNTDMINYV